MWRDACGTRDQGRLPGFAPLLGSCHENLRSCAGALWKGQFGFTLRGGAFPSPAPSPGRYPLGPVHGMVWEEGIIGFASPGAGLPRGIHTTGAGRGGGIGEQCIVGWWWKAVYGPAPRVCAPPGILPRESRGERGAVYGEMPAKGALGAGSPCGSFQGYRLHWLRPSRRRIYRIGSRQIRIGIIEYILK